MKPRRVVSYGLIAGMSVSEVMRSCPGFVLDMFVLRRAYDDEQHQIKRERKGGAW